jgi:uncharacterized damage-inducible protein DinB
MTSAQDLRTLYDYGIWANGKLFDTIVQLTPEQFTQTVVGSYGSVRNTLVHLLSAEWGWLDRCGGPQRGSALVAGDYPTVASLLDRWRPIEVQAREFLAPLNDEDLNRRVEFSFGSGPQYTMRVGELLQHGATHGVHHRGQIAVLLRALGKPSANFDMLVYYGWDPAA